MEFWFQNFSLRNQVFGSMFVTSQQVDGWTVMSQQAPPTCEWTGKSNTSHCDIRSDNDIKEGRMGRRKCWIIRMEAVQSIWSNEILWLIGTTELSSLPFLPWVWLFLAFLSYQSSCLFFAIAISKPQKDIGWRETEIPFHCFGSCCRIAIPA